MKTLSVEECLEILKCERTRFLALVSKGMIPGAKIGKAWVFLEEDINSFLRSEIAKQQEKYVERIEPRRRGKPEITDEDMLQLRFAKLKKHSR